MPSFPKCKLPALASEGFQSAAIYRPDVHESRAAAMAACDRHPQLVVLIGAGERLAVQ